MKGLLAGVLLGASLFSGHATAPQGLIVFSSSRGGVTGVYSIRPDGTHLTRLVSDGEEPRVSPDGTHVAYTTSNFAYTVLDVATGAKRRLKGQVGLGWSYTRSPWSRDGSELAVGADDGVHVFAADGALERVLPHADAGEPSWSPDGSQIAVSGFGTGIVVLRPDGHGSARTVATKGEYALWSPDGNSIAVADFELGGVVTFVVPAAGGKLRRVATGEPSWSPDGGSLAIASHAGLLLYSPAGELQRKLLSGTSVDGAVWSPDGKTVLASVDGDLWLFARDGSSRRQLTQGRRNGYVNSDPSWAGRAVSPGGTPVPVATSEHGPLVAVSRATGAVVARFPRVSGRSPAAQSRGPVVFAVASDGRGGWYVGGDFGFIGGVACPNLAHIAATLRVDRTWCPRPDGAVRALLRTGSGLVVGGEMSHVAGAPRAALAAFSSAGRLTRWAPHVVGSVSMLAADASARRIYVGGEFSRVGAARRADLAAVDAGSGAVTAFAPNPDRSFHGDGLVAFAITATYVYASGFYEHIGGRPAGAGLAQLDAATGKLVAWKPACRCIAWSLAASGGRVFAAGMGGRPVGSLTSFAGATGVVGGWRPKTGALGADLVAPAGSLAVAALGATLGNSPHRLAAYSASSGRRVWLSPLRIHGAVAAIAADARLVVAGGMFRDVR